MRSFISVLLSAVMLSSFSCPAFASQINETEAGLGRDLFVKREGLGSSGVLAQNENFGDNAGVQAVVRVPDKDTVLIAGGKETEVESGVPVLSKVPVLGRLFRSRQEAKDEQKLIVLVKPEIVNSDKE